jgi:hypothetical protein
MQLKIAKYTTVNRPKFAALSFKNSLMVRFSDDPSKIFKTEYFKVVEIEHNSIYAVVPASADEEHKSCVSVTKTARNFPFYISLNSNHYNKMLTGIPDFALVEVVCENIPNNGGIKFLLPDQSERSAPRPLNSRIKTKVKKINKNKIEPVQKPKVVKPVIIEHSPIIEQGPLLSSRDQLKAAVNHLNMVVAKLDNADTKILLRVENNVVKASMNTDL